MSDSTGPTTAATTTRRFAVEPVEITARTHRPSIARDRRPSSPPRRRYVPVLEETSVRSHRNGDLHGPEPRAKAFSTKEKQIAERAIPRRFAPDLIETVKRSRKSGDSGPAMGYAAYKTDTSPSDNIHHPRHLRLAGRKDLSTTAPGNTPLHDAFHVPQLIESSFSSTALSYRRMARQPSPRKSSLDRIKSLPESDDPGNSMLPSLSTSPSAHSDTAEEDKHASRIRESCDDRFSGYLLALAAHAAENQLKEQAMAAYPNEKMYEPVDHFAVDRESDSSDTEEGIGLLPHERTHMDDIHMIRRESTDGWDFKELRRHRDVLEQQGQQRRISMKPELGGFSYIKSSFCNPFGVGTLTGDASDTQKEVEIKKMRSAASPPMQGRDLKFAMCASPRMTRIDPTQRPCARAEGAISRQHTGLWSLEPPKVELERTPDSDPCSIEGLWDGNCTAQREASTSQRFVQTGLITPSPEPSDAWLKWPTPQQPSSLSRPSNAIGVDQLLAIEIEIEREYSDDFVTQIYNYLSLGYPAVARPFDEELSKISRMSIEEIRRDDGKENTKGYVGAPEGEGVTEEEARQECGRWRALRIYINEWARQQPRMAEGANDDWGARARRGSWAI